MQEARSSGSDAKAAAKKDASASVLVASGFAAGVAVTGLLNPYDRALFLSVSEKRPFLDPRNWKQPYHGLAQSIVGRAVSNGLWFPLERITSRLISRHADLSPGLSAVLAGQAAGAANAIFMSPLHVVKYRTWGRPDAERGFGRTAAEIVRRSGAGGLYRGLPATLLRDVLFGGCFGFVRHDLRAKAERNPALSAAPSGAPAFASDVLAAATASVVSAPFNYARNVQFAASLSAAPPSTWAAIGGLLREAREQPAAARLRYLRQRLNVSWGTLRVAGGMALTAGIFSNLVALGGRLGSE